MDLKYKINKNLIFKGIQTMNYGEYEVLVNDKPLCYIDLDNFGFDYKSSLKRKFQEICELICYDLFNGDDYNIIPVSNELGLREIKEWY